jgi:hypothetical protein
MPRPSTLFVSILALPVIALGLAGAQELPAGQAEGRDITVVLDTGPQRGRYRVAVPETEVPVPFSLEGQNATTLFAEVLRADLASSGVFLVQGPQELDILELVGDTKIDYPMYRSLGNEILVETRAREEDGRLIVEGRVFTLDGGRSILGKEAAAFSARSIGIQRVLRWRAASHTRSRMRSSIPSPAARELLGPR